MTPARRRDLPKYQGSQYPPPDRSTGTDLNPRSPLSNARPSSYIKVLLYARFGPWPSGEKASYLGAVLPPGSRIIGQGEAVDVGGMSRLGALLLSKTSLRFSPISSIGTVAARFLYIGLHCDRAAT